MTTANQPALPPKPSPWRQFSLWDALSVMTILCGCLGVYSSIEEKFFASFCALSAGFFIGLVWLSATSRIAGWLAATIFGIVVSGFYFLIPPGCAMPREVPRRMQCGNNTKQIVLALQNYHDAHQIFPPAYFTDATGKPTHSWRVLILPYMEQKPLYDRYRFDEPWDGPNTVSCMARSCGPINALLTPTPTAGKPATSP